MTIRFERPTTQQKLDFFRSRILKKYGIILKTNDEIINYLLSFFYDFEEVHDELMIERTM